MYLAAGRRYIPHAFALRYSRGLQAPEKHIITKLRIYLNLEDRAICSQAAGLATPEALCLCALSLRLGRSILEWH